MDEGELVGLEVGDLVGLDVGLREGDGDGCNVGKSEGDGEGLALGSFAHNPHTTGHFLATVSIAHLSLV